MQSLDVSVDPIRMYVCIWIFMYNSFNFNYYPRWEESGYGYKLHENWGSRDYSCLQCV